MAAPITITRPNVVLVEGPDETRAIPALMVNRAIGDYIQVLPYNGKTNLRGFLKTFTRVPGFSLLKGLGIIRDADTDARAAFQSVQGALRDVGLPVPDTPLAAKDGPPRTAVLILPGGMQPGMLEDSILSAVAADPAIPCVNAFFTCLESQRIQMPSPLSKAKLQVFLASRPDPRKRLGEAAEAGYFPLDHAAFDPIVDLLAALV